MLLNPLFNDSKFGKDVFLLFLFFLCISIFFSVQLSENKSMQAMCCVYAAISYICMGDAESSAKVGTVPSIMEILFFSLEICLLRTFVLQ